MKRDYVLTTRKACTPVKKEIHVEESLSTKTRLTTYY